MSETGLVQIIEGALLAAGKPLTVPQLAELFEEHERPENTAIREALKEVAERCDGRGFELQEVASGFRFQVRQPLSTWVARLWQERPQKYSRALLETLALIAYRQPITRGEIEEIRGVAVSSNIIKTLHEREWIRVVGHRDVPGRPAMYATTRQFLDYFNLKSLDQLPALAEIRDMETLNAELGFTDPIPGVGNGNADGPRRKAARSNPIHKPTLKRVNLRHSSKSRLKHSRKIRLMHCSRTMALAMTAMTTVTRVMPWSSSLPKERHWMMPRPWTWQLSPPALPRVRPVMTSPPLPATSRMRTPANLPRKIPSPKPGPEPATDHEP
jgi:segregation and condensation protein B